MVRVTTKVQPFGVVCQTLWQWWIEAFGKGRTVSQLVILSLPTLLICSINSAFNRCPCDVCRVFQT